MAHKGHTSSCLWTLQGSWQDTVKAKVTSPSSRASPDPACPESTPHACLTKKGGVEGVRSIDSILLQEAGVGKAALDIPAPLPRGVQHRAPLGAGQKHIISIKTQNPGPRGSVQVDKGMLREWAEGTGWSRRPGWGSSCCWPLTASFQGLGPAFPLRPPAC